MNRYHVVFFLLLVSFLGGCRGISEQARTRVQHVEGRVTAIRRELRAASEQFNAFRASGDYAAYRRYAERERWSDSLAEAEAKVRSVEGLLQGPIAKLLRENDPKRESELVKQAESAQRTLREAEKLARRPRERSSAIRQAREQKAQLAAQAQDLVKDLEERTPTIARRSESAAKQYPAKATDLAARREQVAAKLGEARSSLAVVRREAGARDPDYAVFSDAVGQVRQRATEGSLLLADLDKRLDQLGRSYSTTLIDMRIDSFVTVGRSSWNEWSDYDTEATTLLGPAPITVEVEEQLEALGDQEVDEALVRKLGLDPNQNLPSGHDRKEFWIENTEARYYHQYSVFENDRRTTTGWVPVTEAYFERHEDNLGMDILSKPYGTYEDEANQVASPPGLAYVGNTRYGTWSRGTDGDSFWRWYGQYVFFDTLFGGNRYTRRDYDYWNANHRGQSAWYGRHPGDRQEEEDRYGSGSGRVIRHFGDSYWSQTGGFRRQDLSVRGAGSSFRGGGPGGGGK